MNRIVVSLYDNVASAMDAVRELNSQGFGEDSVSVIGHEAAIQKGQVDDNMQQMQGQHLTNMPAIGPVYVRGPMANRLSTYTSGQTHLLDYLMDQGVPENDAHMYTEGVRRGGILVTVTPANDRADQARRIMDQHGPIIVEDVMQEWVREGWDGFDRGAEPLEEHELDWPHSITARQGEERSDVDVPEHDWPENIVDPSAIPPQQEEQTPTWPHSITAREDEPPEREEEEQETNWPHNITARDDEE